VSRDAEGSWREYLARTPVVQGENQSGGNEFHGKRRLPWGKSIYERYQATTEKADAESLSEHRVYELLKEQAILGVVESTRAGGGRSKDSYLKHRLVQDTGIVLKSVLRDSRLEDLTQLPFRSLTTPLITSVSLDTSEARRCQQPTASAVGFRAVPL